MELKRQHRLQQKRTNSGRCMPLEEAKQPLAHRGRIGRAIDKQENQETGARSVPSWYRRDALNNPLSLPSPGSPCLALGYTTAAARLFSNAYFDAAECSSCWHARCGSWTLHRASSVPQLPLHMSPSALVVARCHD